MDKVRIPSKIQDVLIVFETINSQCPIVIASVNMEVKDLLVRPLPKNCFISRYFISC